MICVFFTLCIESYNFIASKPIHSHHGLTVIHSTNQNSITSSIILSLMFSLQNVDFLLWSYKALKFIPPWMTSHILHFIMATCCSKHCWSVLWLMSKCPIKASCSHRLRFSGLSGSRVCNTQIKSVITKLVTDCFGLDQSINNWIGPPRVWVLSPLRTCNLDRLFFTTSLLAALLNFCLTWTLSPLSCHLASVCCDKPFLFNFGCQEVCLNNEKSKAFTYSTISSTCLLNLWTLNQKPWLKEQYA